MYNATYKREREGESCLEVRSCIVEEQLELSTNIISVNEFQNQSQM